MLLVDIEIKTTQQNMGNVQDKSNKNKKKDVINKCINLRQETFSEN